MPTLPRDLYPVTSPSGYSYGAAGGVYRTQVEGGFNRYALDFERGVQQFNVALACTAGHYQIWTLFFYNIIKKGALSFDMPLDSGRGLQAHTVNIIPNSVSVNETDGNNFVVTFQVEAESSAYDFDEGGSGAILALWETGADIADITELFDRLALFVLTETLVLV